MKRRSKDFLVLFVLGLAAVVLNLLLRPDFLVSTLLFLGLPTLYLLMRGRIKNKEAFVAVVLFGIVYGILAEYIAELDGAWKINQLFFTVRIGDLVSIDALIWTALWVLLLVLFYERFVDRDRKDRVGSHVWIPIVAALGILLTIVAFALFLPAFRPVHAYFALGVATIIPLLYALYRKPSLLPKLFQPALYFVPLSLAYELVGRHLGQWDFPGQYYGSIQVVGITFPLEEFFFWILINSAATLALYELFIDDMK